MTNKSDKMWKLFTYNVFVGHCSFGCQHFIAKCSLLWRKLVVLTWKVFYAKNEEFRNDWWHDMTGFRCRCQFNELWLTTGQPNNIFANGRLQLENGRQKTENGRWLFCCLLSKELTNIQSAKIASFNCDK